jgi:hypothetical protein
MPPKTSFGYVEREADSYVNWADVGRTITNTVDEIDRVRTEKKAAIDAAYKEGLEFINNQPKGENEEVTGLTMDLAYNSAENLKIQYNLLKSGKLQTKDFAAYVQTQNDNVKGFYETVGTIQQSFKERQDRMKAEDSQDIELYAGEELEKYGKLSNLQAFYNVNGSLTFGLKGEPDKDGVRKVLPGSQNIMSVNQLKGAVDAKYDRYKYDPDLTTWVEGLGDQLNSYREIGTRMKAGSITEIVDITKDEITSRAKELGLSEDEVKRLTATGNSFKAAEKAFIDARLENKYNLSSILTNNLGFKITESAEEAKEDPRKLLFTKDGNGVYTPVPSPEQKTKAENFLRGQLRAKLDNKIGIKTYTDVAQDLPQPNAAQIAVGLDAQKAKSFGSIIRKFWESGGADREANLNALRGAKGVYDITIDQKGKQIFANVYTSEKNSRPIPLTDENGNPVDILRFGEAFGQWVYGNDIVTTYLKDFEGTLRGGVYNPNYSPETLNSGKVAELQNKIAAKNAEIDLNEKEGKGVQGVARKTALTFERDQLQAQLDALGGGGASATNLNATKKKQGG